MDPVTVQRRIHAPASTIFNVLADPTLHPQIDGSGTLRGAVVGPVRLSQGAEFGMKMRQGPMPYVSTNRVLTFDEGRRIGWSTVGERNGRVLIGGQTWTYELLPDPLGDPDWTLVRQTYDLSTGKYARLVDLAGFRRKARVTMPKSLDRLAGLVNG